MSESRGTSTRRTNTRRTDGMRPLTCVFLDRDGTINKKASEGSYVTSPKELELLPGVGHAIRRLKDAGLRVFIVSNQRGVALAAMTELDLKAVNAQLQRDLAEYGIKLDGIYVCMHDVGCCDCRKPAPGLLLRAIQDHPEIDIGRSVMVGDSETDIAAGKAAGIWTVRLSKVSVATGADWTAQDLPAAVDLILNT